MAKKAKVWDGSAWQDLASATTDLTPYSTTAQMNTAITAGVGLVPILTQTIGTAVSSVVVSNAFNSTYDAYKIIMTGTVASVGIDLVIVLTPISTGYYSALNYINYSSGSSGTAQQTNSANIPWIGAGDTNYVNLNMDLENPFTTTYTKYGSRYIGSTTSGNVNGVHKVATSFTGFTLNPSSGTLTGGTISVYGYKK